MGAETYGRTDEVYVAYVYVPADGDGDSSRRRRRAALADLHQTLVVLAVTVEAGVADLCPPVAVSLLFIGCV